MNLKFAVLRAL